jgi:hypothetical protein
MKNRENVKISSRDVGTRRIFSCNNGNCWQRRFEAAERQNLGWVICQVYRASFISTACERRKKAGSTSDIESAMRQETMSLLHIRADCGFFTSFSCYSIEITCVATNFFAAQLDQRRSSWLISRLLSEKSSRIGSRHDGTFTVCSLGLRVMGDRESNAKRPQE